MFEAFEQMFKSRRGGKCALIFPGGPFWGHEPVPKIECEGGYYKLSYIGTNVCGYEWIPDEGA
jgi:hypothetical protein